MAPKYYSQIIATLNELHKSFPTYNLGKHLSTALDGHGDVWGMSDKELLYVLNKYKVEMELDSPHNSSDEEIEEIIKGGLDLDYLMEDDNGEPY
jgi:hypothetical protein